MSTHLPEPVGHTATAPMRIGLISDTHGLLRPEVLAALEGSDRILHAGDIGSAALLERLARIAPVHAVRGNNDREPWAAHVPETLDLDIAGLRIHMLHDLKTLAVDPHGVDVIVAGHSHRPSVETRDGVLYVNPGSAGRRRFSLPISVGELRIADGRAQARIIELG